MIWPFSKYPPEVKQVKPRLYASIDRATSERLSSPNLAANLDVISVINTALDPGYASVKTCKRLCLRIRGGQQNVQILSLHIVCLGVRHCEEPFRRELAKSDLLKEMGKIGDRSKWAATDIQRMVLHLLQEWAFEVKNHPDFQFMYNHLRSKNAPFEPRDGPMARIFEPYPGVEQQLMQMQHGNQEPEAHDEGAEPQTQPSQATVLLGPDLLKPGKSTDVLQSDIEVAKGTVSLLQEVMEKIEAEGNWEGIKEEYCVEVSDACGAVQKRIETLLGSENVDESIFSAALEVNDMAQAALKKRSELMEIADGTREAPETGTQEQPTGEKVDEDVPKEKKEIQEAPPLIDLLDLDYEPQPAAPADEKQRGEDPFAHLEPSHKEPASNPFSSREQGAQEDSAPNAFLEDAAFAPVISSGGDHSQQPTSSGNPFADDVEVAVPARPAHLTIPNNDQISQLAPHSAPVQSGTRASAFTSEVMPPGTSHPMFPQTFGQTNGNTVPRRHTTDAFEGLVNMVPKNEPAPPPRGEPMKAASPPIQSPTVGETQQDASCFDAFDSISSSK
ncbi:TOM1-like protein 4 [Picochlorum sp. SENEW3]|nr:TOM1-like protein 4 [Picochlorum sp. SENEW3]WPT18663.1 TOM1-like protein 4 [Picochlorum sp. SENEW3]